MDIPSHQLTLNTSDTPVTLYTDSAFNKNKTSCLKGLALEALIKWTFMKTDYSNYTPALQGITLQSLSEKIGKYCCNVYRVKKPFFIETNEGKKIHFKSFCSKKDEDEIDIFFDANVFKGRGTLFYRVYELREIIESKNEAIKQCSYCGKKFPPILVLYRRKCPYCKGRLRKGNIETMTVKKRQFETIKREAFDNFESMKDFLVENKFLIPISPKTIYSKRRLDLWRKIGDRLVIYETKNKEKTRLMLRDLRQALLYAQILNYCDMPIKYVDVIFNGYFDDWFYKKIRWWENNFNIKMKLIPIKEWLKTFSERTHFKIKVLICCPFPLNKYIFQPIKLGKCSKWYLNIKYEFLKHLTTACNYEKLELILREDIKQIKTIIGVV